MRIALGLEYDGTHFCGWQYQPDLRTVQTEIEKALSFVADSPIRVVCAGRTDTGVHALEQIVHFDTDKKRPLHAWVKGTNTQLPEDVVVLWARQVDEMFHARFLALQRHYRYIICNRKTREPLFRHRKSWYPRPLNESHMQKAAQYLLGKHNFSSFRDSGCQSHSPVRCVDEIKVRREGKDIIINIKANAFLHHMVRNIIGVLLEIGDGRRSVDWIKEVLCAEDRTKAGITAPAQGLYLVEVCFQSTIV